jgi:GrpB-like predicted nucleotidyltransferase (UPF0157 family)
MEDDAEKTGVIGGAEKRIIEILDYNPRWPQEFQTHKKIIADALGVAALRIEHIGSTSVPGLAAKPVIDVLLVVEDSGNESSYLSELEAAGYVLRVREPEFHEHRMLRTPKRDVHIHVFSPGSPEIERYLTLRYRLRTSAHERQRYETTKRSLATQPWQDMNAYANAKTEVIEGILAAARAVGEISR